MSTKGIITYIYNTRLPDSDWSSSHFNIYNSQSFTALYTILHHNILEHIKIIVESRFCMKFSQRPEGGVKFANILSRHFTHIIICHNIIHFVVMIVHGQGKCTKRVWKIPYSLPFCIAPLTSRIAGKNLIIIGQRKDKSCSTAEKNKTGKSRSESNN